MSKLSTERAIEAIKFGHCDDIYFHKEYEEAVNMAIKALEQESALDKIRAEIDSYCSDNRDRNDGLYIAMRIIDKYRESEE